MIIHQDHLSYREITGNDKTFLENLYKSSTSQDFSNLGWSDKQLDQFLSTQFNAQEKQYRGYYDGCGFQIIYYDNEAIGRLYISERPDEIRLVDIMLLPVFRNKGIGTTILKNIIVDANKKSLPLRLHVEQDNPAKNLYLTLKFNVVDDSELFLLMEKIPD